MKNILAVIVSMYFILLSLAVVHAEDGSPTAPAGGTHSPRSIIKLDSLVNTYKPVIFNHEKHTAIANDCGVCHHQHGKNSSLPCHECHSIKASAFKSTAHGGFMACKNCHGAYDPATPQMPGLKVAYHRQCFQCHQGMADVGISPKGCTNMCHNKRDQKMSAKTRKSN